MDELVVPSNEDAIQQMYAGLNLESSAVIRQVKMRCLPMSDQEHYFLPLSLHEFFEQADITNKYLLIKLSTDSGSRVLNFALKTFIH